MSEWVIPMSQAEKPIGEGLTVLPEGVWRGQIEEVRVVETHADEQQGPTFVLWQKDRKTGVKEKLGERAEVASIQIGSNQGLDPDDLPDVGEKKFFDDLLVLSIDNHRWDDPSDTEPGFHLERTRRRLTNLALALGAVQQIGDGVRPVPNFHETLLATDGNGGGLSKASVMYEVFHQFGKKDPTTGERPGPYPKIKQYMRAI